MEKRKVSTNIELSIVVVSYFTDDLVSNIKKVFSKEKKWEVIVIRNDEHNVGFSKGCNEGARLARGKYILFMNPDVNMTVRSIKTMISYLEKHPDTGTVGPQFVKGHTVEQTCTNIPSPISFLISQTFLHKLSFFKRIFHEYQIRDWDRKTSRNVGAASGAALLVRKNEFIDIGMFDERFFMYWEEVDLCKRYADKGLNTHYLSKAQAVHKGQESTRRSKSTLDGIFSKSRFHYMHKHFGIITTIFLHALIYLSENILVLSLIFIASFLRSFEIFRYTSFFGDMGRDYLKALEFVNLKTLPLLGIPSSVPRLSQGPFNVWFDALSFLFSGASVFAPPLLAAIVTTIFIVYFYLFLHKRFGKRIAFVMSIFMATSPSFVLQTRSPFYLFAVPIFVFLFLRALEKIRNKDNRSIFFSFLFAFLMLQWEIATLPIAMTLLIVIWKKKCYSPRQLFVGAIATGIALFPKILYDLTHACEQICGVVSWTLYRSVAITGFDGRHGLSFELLKQFIVNTYIQLVYVFGRPYPFAFLLIFPLIFYAFYIIFVKKVQSTTVLYAIISGVLLMIGIFIHGFPSEAYFPPFLVIIPIILSFALIHMHQKMRTVLLICFTILSILQSYSLVSNHFYSQNIQDMLMASAFIQKDANGSDVHLISYDKGSEFNTYLDTYKFILLKNGVKLSTQGKTYVISNTKDEILPTVNSRMVFFGHVTVVLKNM